MKLTAEKPIIEMTKEEFRVIREFIDIFEENPDFYEFFTADDFIADFPATVYSCKTTDNKDFVKGNYYLVKIIE